MPKEGVTTRSSSRASRGSESASGTLQQYGFLPHRARSTSSTKSPVRGAAAIASRGSTPSPRASSRSRASTPSPRKSPFHSIQQRLRSSTEDIPGLTEADRLQHLLNRSERALQLLNKPLPPIPSSPADIEEDIEEDTTSTPANPTQDRSSGTPLADWFRNPSSETQA